MPKLPVVSARKLIQALKIIGFEKVRQTGSHIVMKHSDGRIAVVPNHKEIKRGTLRNGILKPLRISLQELLKNL
ncbi:type II toxin-antitoxin system HicA family toxin [Candidatus Woesebacteria bacterium]|nr:type II toxin-antitoxin system HicA family toxin [Candidatus Woesebacteria bacterium]